MDTKDFNNIYLTGDTHADFRDLLFKSVLYEFTEKDLLIILGDVGINFWGNERDDMSKHFLSAVKCTVLCIHGNHAMRPTSPAIAHKYRKIAWMSDYAYVEDDFPKLIMADEGARYHINGRDFLVIGGAYSVDKPYRLKMGFGWFSDEQLSDEEKDMIRQKVAEHGKDRFFMNFYISDLHIGHENVLKHDGRPFKSTDDMAKEIIRRWNSVVTPHDIVYILGDFSWKNIEGVEVLSQLVGKKYFILGNHDKLTNEMRAYFEWIKDIATVEDNGVQVVLCHYPVAHWRNQYRGAVHLYGHIHNTKDNTAFERYRDICKELEIPFECYNVGCMMPYMDYTPRTLEEIRRSNLR